MRFFISPSQCIPVRQPRGDIATHGERAGGGEGEGRGEGGHRRDAGECGDEMGRGLGSGRKGSRDIFNYQPEVPTLPLPSPSAAKYFRRVIGRLSRAHPSTHPLPPSSYLLNYFRLSFASRSRYDFRVRIVCITESRAFRSLLFCVARDCASRCVIVAFRSHPFVQFI